MISETGICIEGVIREEGNREYIKVKTELKTYNSLLVGTRPTVL